MARSEVPAETTTMSPTPSDASGFATRMRAVGVPGDAEPGLGRQGVHLRRGPGGEDVRVGLGEPGRGSRRSGPATCRGSTRSRARPRGAPGACRGARSPGPRRAAAGAGRAPRPARRPLLDRQQKLAQPARVHQAAAPGSGGRPRHRRQPRPPGGREPEERLVEAARAEAPEVERHVDEARAPRAARRWRRPARPPRAAPSPRARSRGGRSRRGAARGSSGIRGPGRPPRPGRPGGASRR